MKQERTPYWQKLRDPRWQRRRLEIMERDGFACQLCGDKTSPLHVHHFAYERGKEPWDANEELLSTLCESCHEEWHESPYTTLLGLMILRGAGWIELAGLYETFDPILIDPPESQAHSNRRKFTAEEWRLIAHAIEETIAGFYDQDRQTNSGVDE